MPSADIATAFDRALEGRRLLAHPFYQRWEEGTLAPSELGHYAAQYRHIERCVPEILATVAAGLAPGRSRQLVEENLADELGRPARHLDLFDDFACAVGAEEEAPTEATADLIDLYRESATDSVRGLAVLGAYEVQGAGIASSKAAGLRRHYGLDVSATAFWDVHAELEDEHASWTQDALEGSEPNEIYQAARASAEAWWSFLDDREAARPDQTEPAFA